MNCPHCLKPIDDAAVLSGAAVIVRNRRRPPTPEQARAMQERSVEARLKKTTPAPGEPSAGA